MKKLLLCRGAESGISENTEKGDIMEKETIVIFTAKKARTLLKEGFTLVDIKPDKTDSDGKRSVFIFRNETGLLEKLKEN